DFSDDSIDKHYNEKSEIKLRDDSIEIINKISSDELSDDEADDAKAWGNSVRDFYGTNKLDLNDSEQIRTEFVEGEKLRERLNNLLENSDFFNDYFRTSEIKIDENLLLKFIKLKFVVIFKNHIIGRGFKNAEKYFPKFKKN
ncbi:hypothetical protein MXB_4125, partial [Myxobolus squamalis]